jgi:hypothetical protein
MHTVAKIKSLADLIDTMEPLVRKAFLASVVNIIGDVKLSDLAGAISSGNAEEALRVLKLDDAYFRPLDEAMRAAHLAAGDAVFSGAKLIGRRQGVKVTGRFNARNFRAEEILRKWSSDRVVEIAESTRAAVRGSLAEALQRGTSPRAAALDLVGRAGAGGIRSGGLVGLDQTKAAYVYGGRLKNGNVIQGMRGDLENLDPKYFNRKLRDKRFDSVVRRAIRDRKPLSATTMQKIQARYASQMLRLRGETIARTEMLGSLHAAQDEGLRQLSESGQIADDAVTESWDASRDKFTRDSHAAANGQTRQRGEPFIVGGYSMMGPGDASLGAPVEEIANCRCVKRIDINFIKGLRERLTPQELAETRALM